jgi:hypothetical protein
MEAGAGFLVESGKRIGVEMLKLLNAIEFDDAGHGIRLEGRPLGLVRRWQLQRKVNAGKYVAVYVIQAAHWSYSKWTHVLTMDDGHVFKVRARDG